MMTKTEAFVDLSFYGVTSSISSISSNSSISTS